MGAMLNGRPIVLQGHEPGCPSTVGDACECPCGAALALEEQIATHGFAVRYVEYCEDARTPGLLGQIVGVTDWERREVKIKTHAQSAEDFVATLAHEARHVREPEWDCGNRDVLGRGGSR